jgi:FAD-dependent urate hydroxylase
MRVLIVGGGIVGLTLAAKLARQGREPVVVEKAGSYRESGYAISLYPFGSAVLHGIGAYRDFAAASAALETYEIADRSGTVIRALDFARLMAGYGPHVHDRPGYFDRVAAGDGRPVRGLAHGDDGP